MIAITLLTNVAFSQAAVVHITGDRPDLEVKLWGPIRGKTKTVTTTNEFSTTAGTEPVKDWTPLCTTPCVLRLSQGEVHLGAFGHGRMVSRKIDLVRGTNVLHARTSPDWVVNTGAVVGLAGGIVGLIGLAVLPIAGAAESEEGLVFGLVTTGGGLAVMGLSLAVIEAGKGQWKIGTRAEVQR